MIEWLHRFATRIGVKPVVVDTFVAAVALIAYQWITTGSLDVDGLRLAVGLLILGVVGVAAPPAAGYRLAELRDRIPERVRR